MKTSTGFVFPKSPLLEPATANAELPPKVLEDLITAASAVRLSNSGAALARVFIGTSENSQVWPYVRQLNSLPKLFSTRSAGSSCTSVCINSLLFVTQIRSRLCLTALTSAISHPSTPQLEFLLHMTEQMLTMFCQWSQEGLVFAMLQTHCFCGTSTCLAMPSAVSQTGSPGESCIQTASVMSNMTCARCQDHLTIQLLLESLKDCWIEELQTK